MGRQYVGQLACHRTTTLIIPVTLVALSLRYRCHPESTKVGSEVPKYHKPQVLSATDGRERNEYTMNIIGTGTVTGRNSFCEK